MGTEELTTTLETPTSTTTTSTRNIQLITTMSTTRITTKKSTLGIFFGRKSTKLTKVIEAKTTTSTTTTATTTLETPSTSPQVGLLDGLGELLLNNVILKESGKVFQGFMDLLGR